MNKEQTEIDKFKEIITNVGEDTNYYKNEKIDSTMSFGELLKKHELIEIAEELLYTDDDNDIVLSSEDILSVIEGATKIEIARLTKLPTLTTAIEELAPSELKGLILKFTVHKSYPSSEIMEAVSEVKTEVLMGISHSTHSKDNEEIRVTALFIL